VDAASPTSENQRNVVSFCLKMGRFCQAGKHDTAEGKKHFHHSGTAATEPQQSSPDRFLQSTSHLPAKKHQEVRITVLLPWNRCTINVVYLSWICKLFRATKTDHVWHIWFQMSCRLDRSGQGAVCMSRSSSRLFCLLAFTECSTPSWCLLSRSRPGRLPVTPSERISLGALGVYNLSTTTCHKQSATGTPHPPQAFARSRTV
jgi:hypothetical protein